MKEKKWLKHFFLLALLAAVLLVSDGKVFAQKKYIFIYKISGNKVTYRGLGGFNEDSEAPYPGGRKKTMKMAKKVKYYWYKKSNVNKYKKISKKTFLKRCKYGYNPWANEYEDYPYTQEYQDCTVELKNGKIVKMWGEYVP